MRLLLIRNLVLGAALSFWSLTSHALATSVLNGVTINGSVYNVTFSQFSDTTTFNDVFGSLTNPSPGLTFTSSADALAAVSAVLAAGNPDFAFAPITAPDTNGFAVPYASTANTFSWCYGWAAGSGINANLTGCNANTDRGPDGALAVSFATFLPKDSATVPEPGTLALLGLGLMGLGLGRKRKAN